MASMDAGLDTEQLEEAPTQVYLDHLYQLDLLQKIDAAVTR